MDFSLIPIPYYELDWEEQYEPLYGSPIDIPDNVILWRGYDKNYDAISNRFSYYSDKYIAMEYAKLNNRTLGRFVTTRKLRIIDIRFMKNILSIIIQINESYKYINDFSSTIISFGLCSLGHQILLLKDKYKNILANSSHDAITIKKGINNMISVYKKDNTIEQAGIRVAETSNDGVTMAFISELFKGIYDGFISPRLKTEFHVEKNESLSPELLLFHPKDSGIMILTETPNPLAILKISELLHNLHQLRIIQMEKDGDPLSIDFYEGGNKKLRKTVKSKSNQKSKTFTNQNNKDHYHNKY